MTALHDLKTEARFRAKGGELRYDVFAFTPRGKEFLRKQVADDDPPMHNKDGSTWITGIDQRWLRTLITEAIQSGLTLEGE